LVESALGVLRGEIRHVATKADLEALRADSRALETRLVQAIAEGDARLAAAIAALDTRLSSGMASLEGRLIKWLVGTLIASIGTAAAVAKLLV
jgi:hypothetical protein